MPDASNMSLADILAAARAIDARHDNASPPAPQPAAAADNDADADDLTDAQWDELLAHWNRVADDHEAKGTKKPATTQPESLADLESRLRAAHDERTRTASATTASDAGRNEKLLADALASRGVTYRQPDAPRANIRLDGSAWSAADVKLAQELQKYLPGIDLLGARVPPGYRR